MVIVHDDNIVIQRIEPHLYAVCPLTTKIWETNSTHSENSATRLDKAGSNQ